MPKRLQPRPKEALWEIREGPTRPEAEKAMGRLAAEYGDKYPKAVKSLRRDQDKLLTFCDFPAEHWQHIRTSNPVESTFATVRLRQRITKGPGSRKRGLMMAYMLLRMAEERWRRLNGASSSLSGAQAWSSPMECRPSETIKPRRRGWPLDHPDPQHSTIAPPR